MRGTVTLLMTLTYSTKRQNLFFEIPKISRDFYILQMHNSNRLSLYEVLVLVGCSLGDWNVNGVSAVRVAASVRGLWWIHPEDDTRWLSGIRSCRHVLQTNYFTGLCRCIFTYEQCCLCQLDSLFFADVEFFKVGYLLFLYTMEHDMFVCPSVCHTVCPIRNDLLSSHVCDIVTDDDNIQILDTYKNCLCHCCLKLIIVSATVSIFPDYLGIPWLPGFSGKWSSCICHKCYWSVWLCSIKSCRCYVNVVLLSLLFRCQLIVDVRSWSVRWSTPGSSRVLRRKHLTPSGPLSLHLLSINTEWCRKK